MKAVLPFMLTLALAAPSAAHTVNHHVERGAAIVVRVFYGRDDPASYSAYEIFAPGDDSQPYQKGRTDRSGYVSFVPNQAGRWRVKVQGESEHGFHGATIDVDVDRALQVESFNQPLVATHTRLVVGIAVIGGLFAAYALLRGRRKRAETE